jgi:hypothetical protein
MNWQRRMVGLWTGAASAAVMLVCMLPSSATAASTEATFERTLQVNGPVNLDITTGSGNIEVHAGASNQVQITGHIKAHDWFGDHVEERVERIKNNPPILQSGNDLRIGHIDDPDLRHNISISYELVVPANTRLQTHTGSGNQRVEGIQGPAEVGTGSGNVDLADIGGTVRAETGSGNVTIDRVKGNVRTKAGSGTIRASDVAGGFEADTGSGEIKLEQTASGAVRVSTGSGGMELRGVRGSLEAKAGSGNIRADGEPTGAWTVHSGSGGIRLRFPSDAAFDLYAHSGSGSVSVNHPLTVEGSIGKKEIKGKVRGGGVSVEVQTGSGNIDIE